MDDDATYRRAVEVIGAVPPEPMPMPNPKIHKVKTRGDRKTQQVIPDSFQIRQLARSYGEWGIHRLAELARDDNVPVPVQVDCIKTLLDRGYGRAQPLDDGESDNSIRITIRHMLSERAQAQVNGNTIEHDE